MPSTVREVASALTPPPGHRVEVIGGLITVQPLATGKHGRAVRCLTQMLMPYLPCGYGVENHLGVETGHGSDDFALPDLFVAPETTLDTLRSEVPAADVILVSEVVSNSSQTIDRVAKRKQYAEAGIPLYLLIDPFTEELSLFSDPSRAGYRAQHTVPWGDKLQLPEPLPALLDSSLFPSLDGRPRP